jgi:hypothetical protein
MEQIKKIIWINLAILLAYTLLIQFAAQLQSDQHYRPLFVLGFTLYALIAHIGINLLLSIGYYYNDNKDRGKAFILSSLITLLVGFSACWGSAFLS